MENMKKLDILYTKYQRIIMSKKYNETKYNTNVIQRLKCSEYITKEAWPTFEKEYQTNKKIYGELDYQLNQIDKEISKLVNND